MQYSIVELRSVLIELGVVVYTVEQGLNEEADFISEYTHPDINFKKRRRYSGV